MYLILEDLAIAAVAGLFFLTLFVLSVLWMLLAEGIRWLANAVTQFLTQVTIEVGSVAKAAWSQARPGDELLALRAAVRRSRIREASWLARHVRVAHPAH